MNAHHRQAGADATARAEPPARCDLVGLPARHGELGSLFGGFSIADAMPAPVALRVRSYARRSPASLQLLDTMLADAHLRDWIEASTRSTGIPHEEVGAGA
jgi:hypothetical protein